MLPIDEHETVIASSFDRVWSALLDDLDRAFAPPGSAVYARAVGCDPRAASGPRPLAAGSTVPGFRVAAAVPGVELVLEGRHRFSTYALTFRLERLGPEQSRLVAESRATFPGLGGRVYRLLVVSSGGHALAVKRLLSSVQRRSTR